MPFIPVLLKRESDEMLYSWILRLAKANGFANTRSFVNAYILPNATKSEKSSRVLKYDLLEEFEMIYKALGVVEDKQALFLESGLFPYYSLFMTSEQKSAIIDTAFKNNADSKLFEVTSTKMISEMRLCPECMEEDRKRVGTFYYHRMHQIPGVSVCAKHGCHLKIYSSMAMHENDDNPRLKDVTPGESELELAKFSLSVLNANLDGDAEDLKNIVKRKIAILYNSEYEDAKSSFDACFPEMSKSSIFKRNWGEIYSDAYLDPKRMIYLLMFLFSNGEELGEKIGKHSAEDAFYKVLEQNECEMISEYRYNIVELKHKCGFIFSINPKEFIQKWSCPICERKNNELSENNMKFSIHERTENDFRQEIKDLTGDEYTFVGKFSKMNTPVSIRHNKCGRIQQYKPASFIDGARCKYCGQLLRDSDLKKTIASLSNGQYEIIAKRTANLYTVRDTETGIQQDLTQKKILQELKRPTPSKILPLINPGTDVEIHTQINDIQHWIERNCPHGEPIFLNNINVPDIEYKILKARVIDLCKKRHLLKPICSGVYAYADDDIDIDTVVRYKYLIKKDCHIGYLTGSSALFYLGIIDKKPGDYRVVTNNETASNTSGRTTSILGHKLRIKGSGIEINNDNWDVLMLLDTAVNIKKYLHGANTERAFKIMAKYVEKHEIEPEDFAKYQDRYAFSYNAVRKLFRENYDEDDIEEK